MLQATLRARFTYENILFKLFKKFQTFELKYLG